MDCFKSCENGKPWIVSEMVWVSIENKQSLNVLNLEKETL